MWVAKIWKHEVAIEWTNGVANNSKLWSQSIGKTGVAIDYVLFMNWNTGSHSVDDFFTRTKTALFYASNSATSGCEYITA